jgi:hypothetical protein
MRRNIVIATVLLAVLTCVVYWWRRTPRTLRESDLVVVADNFREKASFRVASASSFSRGD